MKRVFSSADRQLAARLEAAEGANALQMAQSAAGTLPELAYEAFAGGTAVFAGVNSPMTHALGIGMRGTVQQSELERMENFFFQRESPCAIDLCPLADSSVVSFIQERGYRLTECNNVLARRILPEESIEIGLTVSAVPADAIERWASVVSRGFAEYLPTVDETAAALAATCREAQCWLAGDREPEAGAALTIQVNVALFLGDATIRSGRGKGYQAALIRARLAAAQRQGCDLATVSVLPGSVSHRNYERAGFELIYMRVNLLREKP